MTESQAKNVSQIWEGSPDLQTLLVPVADIDLDAANVRIHDKRSLNAIASSLREFGQQKPVVIKDGIVIAGNGTISAAVDELGWTHVAAVKFKAPGKDQEIKARGFKIADNRSAELSEWDLQGLGAELGDLLETFDGSDLGWNDFEIEPLLAADWKPSELEELDSFEPPDDKASHAANLRLTAEQFDKFEKVSRILRGRHNARISDGEAVEILCEEYLIAHKNDS